MEKFKKSKERFIGSELYRDSILGYCNWQTKTDNTLLECWTHIEKGPIIIQFFENDHGYMVYAPGKL